MIKGITKKAEIFLKDWFKKESLANPVLCINKGKNVDTGEILYGIGIYKNQDFSDVDLVEINGFRFMVDDQIVNITQDKMLDLDTNGKLTLS